MTFRLDDHWVWDFWTAVDGDRVHLFYLHAPRSLGDPDLRHRASRIGHAVSRDLESWTVLPLPLPDPPRDAFDGLAQWTGSVVARQGRWHLFYTGVRDAEEGLRQRIGVATSDDLVTWRRGSLVLEADPTWYETLPDAEHEEHWRDPWVFHDSDDGLHHMLVTARSRSGPSDGRGVIGHATSPDLERWTVEPPLTEPGEYRQMEVPQLVRMGGAYRLIFSAGAWDHSAARLARGVVAETGTHELLGPTPLGPFAPARDRFVVGGRGEHYAGRLLRWRDAWWFLAWRGTVGGEFLGEISRPLPVAIDTDGGLRIET